MSREVKRVRYELWEPCSGWVPCPIQYLIDLHEADLYWEAHVAKAVGVGGMDPSDTTPDDFDEYLTLLQREGLIRIAKED